MNKRLADRDWFVGGAYSIVDIAIFPWIARHDWQTVDLNDYPNVAKWYLTIAERSAVKAGWNVPENDQVMPMP